MDRPSRKLALILAAALLLAAAVPAVRADDDPDDDDDNEDHRDMKKLTPTEWAAQLATCKAAVTKLNLTGATGTLFCPTSGTFEHFAREMGFRDPGAVDAMIAAIPTDTLKTILSYHLVPGTPILSSSLKPSTTTNLTTAAKAPLAVRVSRTGEVDVLTPEFDLHYNGPTTRHDDEDDKYHESDVVGVDLGFDGKPAPAGAKLVVHAIDNVLLPVAAEAPLKAIRAKNVAALQQNGWRPQPAATTGRRMLRGAA